MNISVRSSFCILILFISWRCFPAESQITTQPWPSYRSSYSRVHEAQKQCPFPSSFSQQTNDEDQGPDPKWVIQNELSFQNGDWFQDPDSTSSPVARFRLNGTRYSLLSSFWITDVDLRSSSGSVRISAALELSNTTDRSIGFFTTVAESSESSPYFSSLTVLLEGVYFENEHNDRGVCLVGCTKINSTRHCDLYLELHFPRRLALDSREVYGFFTSNSGLFDRVSIASQLGAYSKYEFDDGSRLKPACSPSLQQKPPPSIAVYRGGSICSILMEVLSGLWIELASPGPFPSDVRQFQVLDIRCIDIPSGANVSAIFRGVSDGGEKVVAVERKGMSDGRAFAAEGVYSTSTGEICMLGCRRTEQLLRTSRRVCDVRVSMFVALSFSIKQRDILVGKLTSLSEEKTFQDTEFGLFVSFKGLSSQLLEKLRYSYSRVAEAEKRARDEETSLADRVKQSMLKFPDPSDKNSINSLQELGEDLTVGTELINENPESPSSALRASSTTLDVQILTVDDRVLGTWRRMRFNSISPSDDNDGHETTTTVRTTVLVAVEMTVADIVQASAEGVYVPRTGRIHLEACLKNISSGDVDTELDCSTTIVIQYPPRNTQWLVNPIIRVTITSTRHSSDSKFFPPIQLETFPVLYHDQLREILSRKTLEAVLSSVTLSLMLVCIVLQLMYVKRSPDSVPFMSLVMLAVQAFGFSVPLITGAEALFARLTSHSDPATETDPSSAIKDTASNRMLLYLVKILSLAAFLLMLRLCQKVVRYRIRLATKFPLEPRRVPSDVKTAKVFLLVHALGFLTVLSFHYILQSWSSSSSSGIGEEFRDEGYRKPEQDWIRELKEYAGLVEDLFLLPQVIATTLWEIKGKPLRRVYYIGMTALRLLPHVYNAATRPLFNPYFADESLVFANPRMDFYSRLGDVLIPAMAVLLAAMVYAQQRWNELKWSRVLRQGSSKLMRYGSKLYERLPSSSNTAKFEAEMMPGCKNITSEEEEAEV